MQNLQSCTELMLGGVHRDIGEIVPRRKRNLCLLLCVFSEREIGETGEIVTRIEIVVKTVLI